MDTNKKHLKSKSSAIKKKAFLQALVSSFGNVSRAAKTLEPNDPVKAESTRKLHYLWLNEDEDYAKDVESIGEIALDFAENKLLANITQGKETSIIFYLKTKGKNRGYIERQELTGKDGEDLHKPRILTKEEARDLLKDLDKEY